jgi:hypothetical protein
MNGHEETKKAPSGARCDKMAPGLLWARWWTRVGEEGKHCTFDF